MGQIEESTGVEGETVNKTTLLTDNLLTHIEDMVISNDLTGEEVNEFYRKIISVLEEIIRE